MSRDTLGKGIVRGSTRFCRGTSSRIVLGSLSCGLDNSAVVDNSDALVDFETTVTGRLDVETFLELHSLGAFRSQGTFRKCGNCSVATIDGASQGVSVKGGLRSFSLSHVDCKHGREDGSRHEHHPHAETVLAVLQRPDVSRITPFVYRVGISRFIGRVGETCGGGASGSGTSRSASA